MQHKMHVQTKNQNKQLNSRMNSDRLIFNNDILSDCRLEKLTTSAFSRKAVSSRRTQNSQTKRDISSTTGFCAAHDLF